MAKKRNESSQLKGLAGAGSPPRRSLEIFPKALELLGTAAIPLEFKHVVREVISPMDMLRPPELEGTPTFPGIDMTSIETPTPRVSLPPVETPVVTVPVSWPEISTSDRGVNAFYLTELTLNVSGVSHMTPGLRDLAYSTLAPIVLNLGAYCGDDGEDNDSAPTEEIIKHQQAVERLINTLRDAIIDYLIKLLGSDDYPTREAADAEIRRLGEDDPNAVRALIPHLHNPDPEIYARVRRLLQYFSRLEAEQYKRHSLELQRQKDELERTFGRDSDLFEEAAVDFMDAHEDMEAAEKDLRRSGVEERRQRAEAREKRFQEREEKLSR